MSTWRFRPMGGAFLAALVGLGGCRDQGGAPVTPPTPVSGPTSEPTPTTHTVLPFHFGGAFFVPGVPIATPEGTTFRVEVWSATNGRDYSRAGEREGIPIGLATDAPEGRLAFPETVRVPGGGKPGVAEILVAEGAADPTEDYRIWLTESPESVLAPGVVLELDPRPVLVRARTAEETSEGCQPPALTARERRTANPGGEMAKAVFGEAGNDYWSGDWTFRISSPSATVTVSSPYRKPFAEADEAEHRGEWLPHRPALLVSGFDLRDTGDGIEQAMSIGWFADLHLIMESPGCEPVETLCVAGECMMR